MLDPIDRAFTEHFRCTIDFGKRDEFSLVVIAEYEAFTKRRDECAACGPSIYRLLMSIIPGSEVAQQPVIHLMCILSAVPRTPPIRIVVIEMVHAGWASPI